MNRLTQKQELLFHDESEFLDVSRKIYKYVKVLQILKKRPLYTRELLRILRSWGDSHALLKELESLGLVFRYIDYCISSKRKCVYNKISEKGIEFLTLLESLLLLILGENQ
jgi:hypothetical protein